MTLRPREFAWADIPALHALVRERWAVDGPSGQRRIGDMWWALRNTPADNPLRHMQVWAREDGSLAACAFLDPPGLGDVIVSPEAPAMVDEAMNWLEAEHRRAGSGSLEIVVLAADDERAAALGQRGYQAIGAGNVRFRIALHVAPVAAPLPDEYLLTDSASDTNMARRAYVEAVSFGNDTLTAAAWASLMRQLPAYRPELDVLAVAPDGSGASACTNWYDLSSRCGELEAVGTAPAHRRRGVARAVIIESLRRLHAAGAGAAIVETLISNAPAIALYQSCGFTEIGRDYAWTRDQN